jgi:hypothetical protein
VARHVAKSEPVERDVESDPVPPEIHRSALVLRLIVLSVVVVAIGVIAALGGFERAPGYQSGPPTVAVGELVDAGVWNVTIHSAAAGPELRGSTADEGTYLLAVDATIVNIDNRYRPMGFFSEGLLSLDGLAGLKDPEPSTVSTLDEKIIGFIQPGLTERISFLWEVEAGTPIPSEVTVLVNGAHERLTNFTIFNTTTDDVRVDAIVTVPVTRSTTG